MTGGVGVEHLWKYFGDFAALRDITFSLDPGSCTALLGRNGAGKTTLLRILARLSSPSQGAVRLDGHSTGWLGHGIAVYDELSAEENLLLFARLHSLPNPRQAASLWLEKTGLQRVSSSLVREFSRGMRQRLAIARAFLHTPSLLLLDEPFTSLDDRAIQLLHSLLHEAIARGATAIMSTHQLREALELASGVVLLIRGRLAHAGPRTQAMLDDPAYLYRTYGDPA